MRSEAPGLCWRIRANGDRVAYWLAPSRARKRGFTLRTQRLWTGQREPTAVELQKIKIACHRLYREMREWIANPERKRPHRMFHKEGNIYFARAGDRIKIGFTGRDVRYRLIDIQSMVADKVELIGVMRGTADLERALHARFAHLKHRGEWFNSSAEIVSFIAENKAATPNLNILKHLNTEAASL